MEIRNLGLTALRNLAHFQFITYVIALISKFGAALLGIVSPFDKLKAALKKEDDLLKRIEKSHLTEAIKEEDKVRDTYYRSIVALVKVALKHYSAEVRTAAARLKILLDTYGDVAKLSYDEQTAAIFNLMQELENAYKNDVALCRIKDTVDELKASNNRVDDLIQTRMEEDSAKNKDVMKELRAETDAVYNEIRKFINAGVIFEGPAKYEAFIGEMNTLVDRYRLLIVKAKGKNSKKGNEGVENEEND